MSKTANKISRDLIVKAPGNLNYRSSWYYKQNGPLWFLMQFHSVKLYSRVKWMITEHTYSEIDMLINYYVVG